MSTNRTNRVKAEPIAGERRRGGRDLVDYIGQISAHDAGNGAIRIVNISPFGLMGRSDFAPVPGSRVSVMLPSFGAVSGEVRWTQDGRVGVEFAHPFSAIDYLSLLSQLPARARAGDKVLPDAAADSRASQRL